MSSSNIIMGSGDKLNYLSTLLLYVYRAKYYNKDYDKKNVVELVKLVKSKNTDISNLKGLITNTIDNDVDRATLLDSITINLPEESPVLKKLKKLIMIDLEEKELNKYLTTMGLIVNTSTSVLVAESKANQTTFNLNTKDMTIEDRRDSLLKLRDELNKLEEGDVKENDEMDSLFLSKGGIAPILERKTNGERILLKTGWQDLNKGLGGGLSTGEFVDMEALSHKNKTGFALSVWLSMIFNNTIKLKDGRIPLFLWISLEDPVDHIITKIFVYLWFRKHKEMPLLLEMNSGQIEEFVTSEFKSTGIEVAIKRIDPDKFTIDTYKRMIRTYKLLNYRLICTVTDYLEKAYTDGSMYNTGTIGSGLKNMVTKFRTCVHEESILFITPWQISTNANDLLKAGTTDREFLPSIGGKGYTQGSRALIQELDVQMQLHLCTINGIHYQAVQIQKLKRPTYVDHKDKYMLIPFEKNVTINGERYLAPLMEDCSATNVVIKDSVDSNNDLGL